MESAYQRIDFKDISGWREDAVGEALAAFADCHAALACDAEAETNSGLVLALSRLSLQALALLDGAASEAAKREFFEANFTPHKVRHSTDGGLFTGYYEPELDASRQVTDDFCVPLYRSPPDLEAVVGDDMRGAVGGQYTHVRRTEDGFTTFPTRQEIECGALAGQGLEFAYLTDPVEAFFLHVQGSGLLRFSDGTRLRIGYDGKNGYPYTSVGQYVANQGWMERSTVTLDSLKAWLSADHDRGRQAMWQNKSFIFFKELGAADSVRPCGVKDIPLTPWRSLAVDASHHQIGTPVFAAATDLRLAELGGRPFERLMVAQDVGSAITGPERADIYYGTGSHAGQLAGTTKHQGNLVFLLPNDVPAQ